MKIRVLLFMIIGFGKISSHYAYNLCYQAIEQTAPQSGVSATLLSKIAQVESGIGPSRQPWPWTVNVQGRDYYFKTSQGALQYIQKLQSQGITSFDVGCFQINWRWHQHKVHAVAELLDPLTNTMIAAQFLQDLYQRHHSVYQAVAHYHSADTKRGQAYVQRVFKQ